jgi:hypothetical protein
MVFINDETKELFLHIPKCGGCHIRTSLLSYYNYVDFFNNNKHDKLNEYCNNIDDVVNDKHTITKMGKYRYFISHQNYDEKYRDYFKYTFVRNPYDKLYSSFTYLKECINENKIRGLYENKDLFIDFKTFIINNKNINNISYFHAFITQYDQLINEKRIVEMNYIGNQETLDEDFLFILNRRKININKNHLNELFKNVKTNATYNKNNKNIIMEYDQDILNFVNNHFANDFLYFGYKKYDTIKEFVNNYYEDIEHLKTSKRDLHIHKMANIVEYNVGLLEELCKEYENVKTNYEYKLELLNDNKSALFFKVFQDIKTLKQLSDLQEDGVYKCDICNLSCYNKYTLDIHKRACVVNV